MTERSGFVRRDDEAYAEGLAGLLPTGPAWPRDPEGALARFLKGAAGIWGKVDQRAADLTERETDPRQTLELLPEWERAFGLPDPCVAEPQSIGERQKALVQRMTAEGGQSRAFFYGVAENLGYTVKIEEFAPFMAGVSACGDTRPPDQENFRWSVAAAEIRFFWKVKVLGMRLIWFRCGNGGGQCGIDPMVRIRFATDLECLFDRWKPAQTRIVYDYSETELID